MSYVSTLLKSSNDFGWSTLFAELRSHSRYEGSGAAPPPHAQVEIVVRGTNEALLTEIAGSWQSARPTTGAIWLKPIGGRYDEACIRSPLETMKLYVPSVVFARLMDDYNLSAAPERSIRHSCGVQDELINQIGLSGAVGVDVSDRGGPHARGRLIAAARGTADESALGPVSSDCR